MKYLLIFLLPVTVSVLCFQIFMRVPYAVPNPPLSAVIITGNSTTLCSSGHMNGDLAGASTGIGQHAALELVAMGFTVFAGVRRKEDGDSLRGLLRGAGSSRLLPILLDVTEKETIDDAFVIVKAEMNAKVR
jgi:hypothetical protein